MKGIKSINFIYITSLSIVLLTGQFSFAETGDPIQDSHQPSWRLGIGAGGFSALMHDMFGSHEPGAAGYWIATPFEWNMYIQYCSTRELHPEDVLIPTPKRGASSYALHSGFRLEYSILSGKETDTSNDKRGGAHQESKSKITGSVLTLSYGIRGGRTHGIDLKWGLALGLLKADITDTEIEQSNTMTNRSTSFGFMFGFGYNLRLHRHIFWRVIGFDEYFFLNNTLGLPDFASTFVMMKFATEITYIF